MEVIYWGKHYRRLMAVILGGVILLALFQLALLRGVQFVSTSLREKLVPIYRVDTGKTKKIALTFDATWGADYTPRLLEILRTEKVKATFFLAGFWLEKYPEMARKIAQEGHELGNHTYSHPHLNSLPPAQIAQEIQKTHTMIKEITGKEARVFRPPFGEYSNKVIEVAKQCGYETIIWDVDSLDWKNLSAADIRARVTARVKPGSIILFHNAGLHTPEATPQLIRDLRSRGFQFVPLSELLLKGDYYIEKHTGEQKPLQGVERESEGRILI